MNNKDDKIHKIMIENLLLGGFIDESEIKKIEEPLRNLQKNIETVMKYQIDPEVFPFPC